jgi:toxin CptA
MHYAPAVSFPVGRSRFQAGFILLFWLIAAGVQIVWASQLPPFDWRALAGGGLVLAVGIWAGYGWRKSAQGHVRWDGKSWSFEMTQLGAKPAEPKPVALSNVLDFQWVMLLLLRFEGGRAVWCWLDRPAKVADWLSLRRAVFARKPAASRLKMGDDIAMKMDIDKSEGRT